MSPVSKVIEHSNNNLSGFTNLIGLSRQINSLTSTNIEHFDLACLRMLNNQFSMFNFNERLNPESLHQINLLIRFSKYSCLPLICCGSPFLWANKRNACNESLPRENCFPFPESNEL